MLRVSLRMIPEHSKTRLRGSVRSSLRAFSQSLGIQALYRPVQNRTGQTGGCERAHLLQRSEQSDAQCIRTVWTLGLLLLHILHFALSPKSSVLISSEQNTTFCMSVLFQVAPSRTFFWFSFKNGILFTQFLKGHICAVCDESFPLDRFLHVSCGSVWLVQSRAAAVEYFWNQVFCRLFH